VIHFIYGGAGTGKTYTVFKYIQSDLNSGKRALLIVPEQETVATEREAVSHFPASAQLELEVLNFSRLCNTVFRKYGGLSYNFATKTQKSLIMWNTLRELSPILEEFSAGEAYDFSLTQKMLSAVTELKAYCISPTKLEMACGRIDKASPLYKKLRDISLVYSAYTSYIDEHFSDSSDDISKAIEILKNESFFDGTSVYLDSFAGFTKQEIELICAIANLSEDVYITIPISTPNDCSIHSESLRATVHKLKKYLAGIPYDEVFLTDNHRSVSEEIEYLSANIWNFEAKPYAKDLSNDISAYICDTPYSESDTVASMISREIQSGARYSDIAIIVRDAKKYRGILDTSLSKYGIPYFMSEKTDLMTKPLVKFLLGALKIKENNWRLGDVIAHLKSGFCDVDPYDADIFEDYVSTWRICGSKFFEDMWTMNPDGYSAVLTKRGEKIIATANAVKRAVVPPLSLYFTRLEASETVKDMCAATVQLLKDAKITEKVRVSCADHLSRGDRRSADEDMKLYNLTLNILYELSSVFGDRTFTVEEFSAALMLMFSESDVGTIPTSADEVLIGSANMLRTGKIKVAILMGLNEGEFPASVKDNGIFTDSDKATLEELELSLSADTGERTSDELFFLYRALSAPQNKLILSASSLSSDGASQRQSLVFDRLEKIFPSMRVVKEGSFKTVDKIWNSESAKEHLTKIRSKITDTLIKETDGGDALIERLSVPLSKRECTVSPEIVKRIFGERLSLTQSRLEKYVLCGFDYYCSYVLGLRESKRAVFQLNDIGTFIHYILESFMKEITADGEINLTLSDAELDTILSRCVKNYLFELLGENYAVSGRTKHLFLRLHKLSFMIAKSLIDEFRESDFYPSFFELKVGMGDSSIKALEFELKDGSTVSLRGIADRIDTYKKDSNVYIRVVDYKTGSKEFSFDDLKDGLNTQLLIYLFSLCYAQNDETKSKLGCGEDGKLIPAGIQYLSSNAPVVSIEKFCESDEVERLIQNEFSRSGLLLSDPEILTAMNHKLDSKIISKIKTNDDGTVSGKDLVSEEGFDELYAMLQETIIRVAQSMRDGKANAVPLRSGENAPCRYCKMKSVCRASVCKNKL